MGLMDYIEEFAYREYGYILHVVQDCWKSGFFTHKLIEDADGNIVDDEYYISNRDLQDYCDELGLEIDCVNW